MSDMNIGKALEFYSRYGNVHSDPKVLMKNPPTDQQLEAATEYAISHYPDKEKFILEAKKLIIDWKSRDINTGSKL